MKKDGFTQELRKKMTKAAKAVDIVTEEVDRMTGHHKHMDAVQDPRYINELSKARKVFESIKESTNMAHRQFNIGLIDRGPNCERGE